MQDVREVKFRKLYDDVELPFYATEGSAGFDIKVHHFKEVYGALDPANPMSNEGGAIKLADYVNEVLLRPFQRVLISAGFAVAIPQGFELQCRSRSGLALKQGLIVLNAPGTIDSDYRGEIGAIIYNSSQYPVIIKKGERVAQCVLGYHATASFTVVEELDETTRGEGGYGHTGKN